MLWCAYKTPWWPVLLQFSECFGYQGLAMQPNLNSAALEASWRNVRTTAWRFSICRTHGLASHMQVVCLLCVWTLFTVFGQSTNLDSCFSLWTCIVIWLYSCSYSGDITKPMSLRVCRCRDSLDWLTNPKANHLLNIQMNGWHCTRRWNFKILALKAPKALSYLCNSRIANIMGNIIAMDHVICHLSKTGAFLFLKSSKTLSHCLATDLKMSEMSKLDCLAGLPVLVTWLVMCTIISLWTLVN